MASGLDPVHRLYRVTLAGVDLDIMVHLMHSLFSVRVNIYSAIRRLSAYLGELPDEGLPPVVEIPHKSFAAWRSVRAVP